MSAKPVISDGSQKRPTILLFANTSWYLFNFRLRLAEQLAGEGYAIIFVAPRDGYSARLEPFGRFVALEFNRKGVHPFLELKAITCLLRLLRQLKPDAVLSWTPKCNIYGALACRARGIPIVTNVSGLGSGFIGGGTVARIAGALYRLAFRFCATVFFQNQSDLEHFRHAGWIRPDVGKLLPGSGVDLHRFNVSRLPRSEVCRFLFAGRLLGDKGLRELAGAARKLKQESLHARLFVAGFFDEGNPTALSPGEIQSWVKEEILEYLGPTDTVEELIAGVDCVVLPSYREGLPRILLEAAACGRPTIATNVPGCRDAIVPGQTGILCEPHDIASLHTAMATMLNMTADEREEMGRSGRQFVEQNFSDELVFQAYADCLAGLFRSMDQDRL